MLLQEAQERLAASAQTVALEELRWHQMLLVSSDGGYDPILLPPTDIAATTEKDNWIRD